MTAQTLKTDRENIVHIVERLPEKFILQIKGYIERINEEIELDTINAEIAELEAKYGTTPNAKTIAAMKDAEAGLVEPVTLEEIRARCNAIH